MDDASGHTFLLRPGAWRAHGAYRRPSAAPVAASGETKVIHGPDLWLLDGFLRIEDQPPAEVSSRYQLEPLPPGATHTSWKCRNPSLGDLQGAVTVFPECLLLHFVGNDHHHRGAEVLLRRDPDTYLSRGALYAGADLIGAWDMVLTRTA